MLPAQAEGGATGGEDGEAGAGGEQPGDLRRGVEQMLAVIEDQERAAVAEGAPQRFVRRLAAALVQSERLGDAGQDQPRIVHCGEGGEGDPVGVVRPAPRRQRQPRLPHPAGTGEGEEP